MVASMKYTQDRARNEHRRARKVDGERRSYRAWVRECLIKREGVLLRGKVLRIAQVSQ